MDQSTLRRDLAAQYRRVGELRLNELSSGNLSCRFEGGMLISPAGAAAETISEADIVFVGPDACWPEGQRPSSEWKMHWAIYKARPDAGAVVHTHSDACVAVACQNRPLPGFHYLIALFGGDDVPCVPYTTFGGQQLADDAADALRQRRACLLASHGMISHGKTLGSAVNLAHRLEILCRQYLLTRQLGEPKVLTDAQWDEVFAQMLGQRYGGHGEGPPR